MIYAEIPIEDARACCKAHKKKCENCPLRRTRELTTKHGIKEFTLFCYFVLKGIITNDYEDLIFLDQEQVKHFEDYLKWKENTK